MIKTLLLVFTNGKNMRIVRVGSNGANAIELSNKKSKHMVSKADTDYGLYEVKGYMFLDSFFE
jgi:hypothetical protein